MEVFPLQRVHIDRFPYIRDWLSYVNNPVYESVWLGGTIPGIQISVGHWTHLVRMSILHFVTGWTIYCPC